MRKLTLYAASLLALGALGGCAATTAALSTDGERSVARSIDDSSAERVIKARMARQTGYDLSGVDVEVAEGIVLLSGRAPTAEDRIEAERIAWSAPKVTKVGNEIGVGGDQKWTRNIQDEWLATNLRSRMAASKTVKSLNYNIEVHDGIIYLMGVARTQDELVAAAEMASVTPGAKKVVSYVRVADEAYASPSRADFGQPESPYVDTLPSAPEGEAYIPYGDEFSEPYAAPSIKAQPTTPIEEAPMIDVLPDAPLVDSLPDAPFEDAPIIQRRDPVQPDSSGEVQQDEPYYRDPITGERIELPPGTKTVPYDPRVHGPITGN